MVEHTQHRGYFFRQVICRRCDILSKMLWTKCCIYMCWIQDRALAAWSLKGLLWIGIPLLKNQTWDT